MLMRQSTIAVALVVALSAAAATTQVFADEDARVASPVAIGVVEAASAQRNGPTSRSATEAKLFQARN